MLETGGQFVQVMEEHPQLHLNDELWAEFVHM
jgi:hypothetical protein